MNFEISQPTECLQRYLIISGHASFGQEVFWNLPLSLDWRLHLIRMYVCNKKTERYVVSMRRPNTFHNNDMFRQLAVKDSPPFFCDEAEIYDQRWLSPFQRFEKDIIDSLSAQKIFFNCRTKKNIEQWIKSIVKYLEIMD